MNITSFDRWCGRVVEYIVFKPDRKVVYTELYAHLEDKRDALISAGILEDIAVQRAIEAMGDADDVGHQLAKAHKPFWGYLLRCTKLLLILSLAVLVISYSRDHIFFEKNNEYVWTVSEEGRVLYYPDCKDKSDGYFFSVTRLMTIHSDFTNESVHHEGDSIFFTVRTFNIRPWAGHIDLREFYAVDSLGNYYRAYSDSKYIYDKKVNGNYLRTGLFTWEYEMSLDGYEGGAEWIELRYDSCGRDICLHMDLTEGIPYE